MELQFDSDLIDQAVFLEMRRRENLGATELVRRYRRQLDKLYELPQGEAREQAFFEHHLKFFKELGFEKFLLSLLNERPLIPQHITTAVFRKARGKNDEGAELFVREESVAALLRSADSDKNDSAPHRSAATPIQNPKSKIQNLSVSFRAERFLDIPRLKSFLRHELLHIADMLDPAFNYSPEIRLPDRSPAEENIVRERYRILWDTTIDGRLARQFPNTQPIADELSSPTTQNLKPTNEGTRAARAERRSIASEPQRGHDGACPSTNDADPSFPKTENLKPKTSPVRESRLAEFNRAFIFLPEHERQSRFDSLWNGERPTHNDLLEFANHARELATAAAQQTTPPPGAHCPLCKFPTFDWANPELFNDEVCAAIRKDFPAWRPSNGACARCLEVYRAAQPVALAP